MRFGYFDFKEIFTERVKATSPQICMTLAALFVCLCPLTANAQARRINGYAVQVAALSSQKSADELVRGLSARGMNAYWVWGMSYVASASAYAEKLLGAGLLASYAIASYEPPAKANSAPSWKIQNLAQKLSGRRLGPDLIDVVAAIGSRGWRRPRQSDRARAVFPTTFEREHKSDGASRELRAQSRTRPPGRHHQFAR